MHKVATQITRQSEDRALDAIGDLEFLPWAVTSSQHGHEHHLGAH